MAISMNCPCGQKFRVREEYAGRRVKCPNQQCGRVLQIPPAASGGPQPSAEELDEIPLAPWSESPTRLAGDSNASHEGDSRGTSCPECGADLAPKAVLCVQCGFDLRHKKRHRVEIEKRERSKKVPIVAAVTALVLLGGTLGVVFLKKDRPKSNTKSLAAAPATAPEETDAAAPPGKPAADTIAEETPQPTAAADSAESAATEAPIEDAQGTESSPVEGELDLHEHDASDEPISVAEPEQAEATVPGPLLQGTDSPQPDATAQANPIEGELGAGEAAADDVALHDDTDTTFENHTALAAAVKTANQAVLYEGLPSPAEDDVFQKELSSKQTIELHGYRFYEEPLKLKSRDRRRLTGLFCNSRSFQPYGGEKAGGGFHPDFCVEWRIGDEVYHALVCFGSLQMKAYGPDQELLCDIKDEASKQLRRVLRTYRKQRPKPVFDVFEGS